MSAQRPRATIVVVNYNGRHLLAPCLDAVHGQVEAPVFETVVVDNASVDGSLDLLEREYPWVTVVRSAQNLGFAGGNNLALWQVRTPYAVLLNNDAVPEPDWLACLLAEFERPGNEDVAVVTGKIVFLPRFAPLCLRTPGFRPGNGDTRDLGVRILDVEVAGVDVTEKVQWNDAAYGPEGTGAGRFRWTRPDGEILVPVAPGDHDEDGRLVRAVPVHLRVVGPGPTTLSVTGGGGRAEHRIGAETTTVECVLPVGTRVVDVINNAGGIVLSDGSGADRGFQEVDHGQYEDAQEVFSACGNGMAIRTAVGRELGFFDDAFFMYYEDTDLSWRCRAGGWSIRYVPAARLRHIHSASSTEWSPLWTFHVERNRLLMLTKNATAPLAAAAVGDYAVGTARLLARAGIDVAHRRRPALRTVAARGRVLRSYLRLGPAMARRRLALGRTAVVPREGVQKWLAERR